MRFRYFYRNFCNFISVSWFRSLLFNFRYLPLHQAIKMPIIAGIPAKTTNYRLQRKDLNAIKDIEDFEITKGIKVFG